MIEKGHRQLKVWQMAIDLAMQIHKLTLSFPREELYGLTSQMRRAAVSISSRRPASRSAALKTPGPIAFQSAWNGSDPLR